MTKISQAEIDSALNSVVILEDRQVLHRADTQGVVITRVVWTRFQIQGQWKETTTKTWCDWQSGQFHHQDFTEVNGV